MLTQYLPPLRVTMAGTSLLIVALVLWWKGDAALLGAVVGAVLAGAVAYFNDWRRDARQLRVARMSVANDLRHWLSAVLKSVVDVDLFENSGGCAGAQHGELPSLRFETDLTDVAVLENKSAKTVRADPQQAFGQ